MRKGSKEGERVQEYFASTKGDIRYIFAPFIQKDALDTILPESRVDTVIVTRWRAADLVSGVSDPDVFQTVKDQGYTLKIHPRLHAKVYSWDLDTGLVGSANLTHPGMGISEPRNIEVLYGPTSLPVDTQLKLRQVEKEAQLVTRNDYEEVVQHLEETETKQQDYGNIDIGNEPEFLVSHLPMTEDPETLISVLAGDASQELDSLDSEEQSCVLHDIATYSLDDLRAKSESKVREELRNRFLDHDFIQKIVEHMDPCIYFGEMKALVQDNCTDVPTPSRRELTGNIQVLYSWFPKVAPNRFEHDIPGTHSERLCDNSKT